MTNPNLSSEIAYMIKKSRKTQRSVEKLVKNIAKFSFIPKCLIFFPYSHHIKVPIKVYNELCYNLNIFNFVPKLCVTEIKIFAWKNVRNKKVLIWIEKWEIQRQKERFSALSLSDLWLDLWRSQTSFKLNNKNKNSRVLRK